jgi:hypothetical protein
MSQRGAAVSNRRSGKIVMPLPESPLERGITDSGYSSAQQCGYYLRAKTT